jgi:hypothetical protein
LVRDLIDALADDSFALLAEDATIADHLKTRYRTGDDVKTYRLLGSEGPYDSPAKGILGGNGAAKIYGQLDCRSALNAIAKGDTYQKHRVFFADEAAAIASGYRPCGNCMKPQYAAWKEAQQ